MIFPIVYWNCLLLHRKPTLLCLVSYHQHINKFPLYFKVFHIQSFFKHPHQCLPDNCLTADKHWLSASSCIWSFLKSFKSPKARFFVQTNYSPSFYSLASSRFCSSSKLYSRVFKMCSISKLWCLNAFFILAAGK